MIEFFKKVFCRHDFIESEKYRYNDYFESYSVKVIFCKKCGKTIKIKLK